MPKDIRKRIMEYLELLQEIGPYLLSILATIISFRAEKRVKPGLTDEAIKEKAEKKKEAYLKKHLKNFQEEKKVDEANQKVVVNSYEKLPEEIY